MRRAGHVSWMQLRVGGLIVLAFVIFLWASFHIPGPSILARKHTCVVYFSDVSGILSGNPIRMGGVVVGSVANVSFDDFPRRGKIRLTLRIQGDKWKLLHHDAYAELGTMGLLGDAIVVVHAGSLGEPPIQDGQEIRGVEVIRISELGPTITEGITDLRAAAQGVTEITREIMSGRGTASAILHERALHDEMLRFATSGRRTAENLDRTQAVLSARLARLARNLDDLATRIQSPETSTGRLLADDSFYRAAHRTVTRLDSLSAALSEPDKGGTLGAMLRDRALYDRTTSTVAEVESLITEVEKHPERFFRFSVF